MTKKEAYWAAHLAAIDAGGFTTAGYARREGLSAKSLFYWRGRLRRAGSAPEALATVKGSPAGSRFAAVAIRTQPAGSAQPACSVIFGTNMRLDFVALPEPAWIVELLRASRAGGL